MTSGQKLLTAAAVLIFAIQAAASYGLRHEPYLPVPPPLAELSREMGPWEGVRENPIEPEIREILGADDMLARDYRTGGGSAPANLFVAYYKTQLRAKNAHDPRVCLPGAGWNPRESRQIEIPAASGQRSFVANYYQIARGNEAAVVIYWYQTHKGVYTFAQQLSWHRVLDSITDNRTDMALVRILVPAVDNAIDAANAEAIRFAQLVYPAMLPYFPVPEKAAS